MIIQWTYGAYAQTQQYFGVGYWLTDSVLGFSITTPAKRTITISADVRSVTVESDARTVLVAAEDRIIIII